MLFEKLQILSGTLSRCLPLVFRINQIYVVHQMHFLISNLRDVNPKSIVRFFYPPLMEAFFNNPKTKHVRNVTNHVGQQVYPRCSDSVWASPLWWRKWPEQMGCLSPFFSASIDIVGGEQTHHLLLAAYDSWMWTISSCSIHIAYICLLTCEK